MSEPTGGASGAGGNDAGAGVEARFHDAVARHRTGELDEAQGLYESILRDQPDHADSLHMLGLVALEKGHYEDAKRFIGDAVGIDEANAFYQNNLGETRRVLGEFKEAAECYRKAIELEPGYSQAHNNLGMTLFPLGEHERALTAFKEALRIAPNEPGIHNNLGVALEAMGRLDEAITHFRRSLEIAPEQVEVSNNLGAAMLARGELDEAERYLSAAAAVNPDLANVQFNLSRLNLARGNFDPAIAAARKAIELNPRYPDCFIALANVQRAKGELEESLDSLRSAVAIDSTHALALNDMGVILLILGRFEEADSSFRRALHAEPRFAIAHENLAKAKRYEDSDRAKIEHVEALASEGGQTPEGQTHLHFALGKMLDDVGEYERAMQHYVSGNALEHARTGFDAAAGRSFVERSRATFDAAFIDSMRALGNPSDEPIFIVGTLRSGTTLIEQILAAHPAIHAAGELDYFRNASTRLAEALGSGQAYPECLRDLDADTAHALAGDYLEWIAERKGNARRFTDKNPLNIEHLGLIMLLFPNARVIHCRRDPMDVCLSIFFQHFAERNDFAYSFADIAEYHHQQEQLASHWRSVFPGRIHEVVYEDLVANFEPVVRAMLEYLGLEWDAACLDYHQILRPVGTASHWQVRQPLYTHSVERWRHYAPWLAELRAALGDRQGH